MLKYELVYNEVKDKIIRGELKGGALIGTEKEICHKYKVSRITVRRALEELEKEELIKRIHGIGSFVKFDKIHSGESSQGFLQNMICQGKKINSILTIKELINSDDIISDQLKLKTDSKVWHFQRIRLVEDSPVAIMDTYVNEDLGEKMLMFDLENVSFYKIYSILFNMPISSTNAYITAINPSDDICDILKVQRNSAHIGYRSVGIIDSIDYPIEYNKAVFNSNYYEFAIRMDNPNTSLYLK